VIIVFDLDDTLYMERDFVYSGFGAVECWLSKTYSIKGFFGAARKCFERGIRGKVFDAAFEDLGVKADNELIRQMVNVYREHEPEISLLDDAKAVLDQLNASDLGLITDGFFKTQRNKVRALGLTSLIQHSVISDDWGRKAWKPSRMPYQRVMQIVGNRSDRFAYVGDNPEKDFVTAKKLGWLTVRVRRTGGKHYGKRLDREREAGYEVSILEGLPALLLRPKFGSDQKGGGC